MNPFNKLLSSSKLSISVNTQTKNKSIAMLKSSVEYMIGKKKSISNSDAHALISNQKQFNSVLAQITPTEFFAVFLSMLNSSSKQSTNDDNDAKVDTKVDDNAQLTTLDDIISLLVLLSLTMPHVPQSVLQQQFATITPRLGSLLNEFASHDTGLLYTLRCMSILLLRVVATPQNIALWNHTLAQKLFQGMLVFAADERADVRKIAANTVSKVFRQCSQLECIPANVKRLSIHFLRRELSEHSSSTHQKTQDLNTIVHLCQFLFHILHYFNLRESSQIIQSLFDVIANNADVSSKHLPLQHSFLALTGQFVTQLPAKFEIDSGAASSSNSADVMSEDTQERIEKNTGVNVQQLASAFDSEMNLSDNGSSMNTRSKCAKFLIQFYPILQQLKPFKSDVVGMTTYYDTIGGLLASLYYFDTTDALSKSVSIITVLIECFESNKNQIVSAGCRVLVKLLQTIVTDELIKETLNSDNSDADSLPALHRIVALIQSLLHYRYQSNWLYSFDLCAKLFRIFGADGFAIVSNVFCELCELRSLDSPPFIAALDASIGSAIRVAGPQQILEVFPLQLPTAETLKVESISVAIERARVWMLPLLQKYVHRTNLVYFGSHLLPKADLMMKLSEAAKEDKMIVKAKTLNSIAHMIWRTFPSFCIYPLDAVESFPTIAEGIGSYLASFMEVRRYIINGIIHLLEQPLTVIHENTDEATLPPHFTRETAQKQIDTIASFAKNFLPILFNIVIQSPHSERRYIVQLVELFARASPTPFICGFFKRTLIKYLEDDKALHQTMEELETAVSTAEGELKTADESNDDKNVTVIDDSDIDSKLSEIKARFDSLINRQTSYLVILETLTPHIPDAPTLTQFYGFLKQQFAKSDVDNTCHKLLYRNLEQILSSHIGLLVSDQLNIGHFIRFLKEKESISIALGPRSARLSCIRVLLECLPDPSSADEIVANSFVEVYPQFLGEILAAMSEASTSVNTTAFKALVVIVSRLEDISQSMFDDFFLNLLAGLLCDTPQMQVATITALRKLIVYFEMRVPSEVLSKLLETVSLRIKEPSPMVVKAALQFIAVMIVHMPTSLVESNLSNIVTTLLNWTNDDSKRKYRTQISKNLDKLLRRFGYEKLTKLIPPRYQKLIKYLRKRASHLSNRKQDLKSLKSELEKSKDKQLSNDNSYRLERNAEEIDSESDESSDIGGHTEFAGLKIDGVTTIGGKSKKSSMTQKSKGARSAAPSVRLKIDRTDVIDLMSRKSINANLLSVNDTKLKSKDESMKRDKKRHGGSIRTLKDGRFLITEDSSDEDHDEIKLNHDDDDDDSGSGDDNEMRGINDKKSVRKGAPSVKRGNQSTLAPDPKKRRILDNVRHDVWKPGELQPYAYHIVSPSLLNRKKQHLKGKTFASVMGKGRKFMVRDGIVKASRTRKIRKGRITLKRAQVKAQKKHASQQNIDKSEKQKKRLLAKRERAVAKKADVMRGSIGRNVRIKKPPKRKFSQM